MQAVLLQERQRAVAKRVGLGAALLAALGEDRRHRDCSLALLHLGRHAEGARRRAMRAGLPPGPAAGVVAQRLLAGGHLLRSALRHADRARREWALQTWSLAAARLAQAEARELVRRTAELSEQLREGRRKVPLEGVANTVFLAVRSAQTRRMLLALSTLAAHRPRPEQGEARGPASPSFGAAGAGADSAPQGRAEYDFAPEPRLLAEAADASCGAKRRACPSTFRPRVRALRRTSNSHVRVLLSFQQPTFQQHTHISNALCV